MPSRRRGCLPCWPVLALCSFSWPVASRVRRWRPCFCPCDGCSGGVCVGGFQFLSRSVSVPGLCFGRWLSHVQSLVGGAVLTLSGGRQQPFLEAGLASHCVTVTLGCRRLHVGCAGLTHLPAVGELLGRLCLLCVLSPHVPQLSRGVSTLCRLPELCRRLSLWNPARDSRRPRPESSGLCPRPGSPPHPGACLQAELGRLVQGRSPLASL